jgi:hypothetical protein
MTYPRAPKPIVVSEPFYNTAKGDGLQDYELHDIPLIRASVKGLKDHSDLEIACLWRYWSVDVMCAGWIAFDEGYHTGFGAFEDWLQTCDFDEAWNYN